MGKGARRGRTQLPAKSLHKLPNWVRDVGHDSVTLRHESVDYNAGDGAGAAAKLAEVNRRYTHGCPLTKRLSSLRNPANGPRGKPAIAARQNARAGALASNTLTSHSPRYLFQRCIAICRPIPSRRNPRNTKNSWTSCAPTSLRYSSADPITATPATESSTFARYASYPCSQITEVSEG